jgi:c-di-GMP-binding flagellar brake protein YcgR
MDVRVVLMIGDGSTVRGAIGRSNDISEGGIGAFLPASLTIGQNCALQFNLPGGESMHVTGRVRTRASFRYGFEFATLSSRQREQIKRACHTLAALQK